MDRFERTTDFAIRVMVVIGGTAGMCATVGRVGPVATAVYTGYIAVAVAALIAGVTAVQAVRAHPWGTTADPRTGSPLDLCRRWWAGVRAHGVLMTLAAWTNAVAITGSVALYGALVVCLYAVVAARAAVRADIVGLCSRWTHPR